MKRTTHNLLAKFGLVILEPGLRYECGGQPRAFQIDFDNKNNGNNNKFNLFASTSVPLRNKYCKQNVRKN
jgi:hypothetical protein